MKMKIIPILCVIAVGGISTAFAQEEAAPPPLEKQIPASVINTDENNFMTLTVENDSLGKGTDQNYTSGVRLTYMDFSVDMPAYAYHMADIMPIFDINKTTSLYYSLGQNLYTPENITSRQQDPDDRPWAAWLYASVGMSTIADNHMDQMEATVGMVGPAALGKQAQKFIHSHITDSPSPKGWSNQLENEPGLMLAWQRSWPQAFNADIGPLFLAAAPHVGATVGNVYTYANGGVSLRLGPDSEKWQDLPVQVRPSMPGSGFFEIPRSGWSWYLFAGTDVRAVAHNIFLDGNTFSDSHSVDKKPLVTDLNAGLAITYDQFRIGYTLVYRTKEFDTQTDPQVFGALTAGWRF